MKSVALVIHEEEWLSPAKAMSITGGWLIGWTGLLLLLVLV